MGPSRQGHLIKIGARIGLAVLFRGARPWGVGGPVGGGEGGDGDVTCEGVAGGCLDGCDPGSDQHSG